MYLSERKESAVGVVRTRVQKLGGQDSSTGGINSESPLRIGIGMRISELLLHVAGTPVHRFVVSSIWPLPTRASQTRIHEYSNSC